MSSMGNYFGLEKQYLERLAIFRPSILLASQILIHPSEELLANKLVSGIETNLFTAALCS